MIFLTLFAIAGAFAIIRAIKGPSFADRMLAIDSLVAIIVIAMVFYAVSIGNHMFMDTAIVIAMLGFIGTIGISKYSAKVKEDER